MIGYAVRDQTDHVVRWGEFDSGNPAFTNAHVTEWPTIAHGLVTADGIDEDHEVTVGWTECVFCGAPLTDCPTTPATRRYCGSACETADADC